MASKKYFVDINLQSNKVDNLKADTLDITTNLASANTKRIVYWNGSYYYSDGTNWITMGGGGGSGTVTSVGLTMPSAFNVSNSPITTNGDIAVIGAGTTADYIRGDGTLAAFPSLTGYVPYTGATADLDLGTHNLTADHITLNTNPSGAGYVVGTTQWNNTDGTSETLLKGGSVSLKNGVDLVARVVNNTGIQLTKAAYQVVKVSGAQGQRLAVDLARANNDLNSADTLGIVTETINNNQEGFIMAVGQLTGINTTGSLQGETWSDGEVLYLSPTTAGAITNVKPNGLTGHIVVLGYVEYAHPNNGKIYVKIMNGWELSELHDCYINNPLNNQLLTYTTPDNLWENKSLGTVLGGVPSQYVRGDGTLASFPDVAGGGGGQVYYFNGGVSQGTIGGNSFYQISTAANIPSSSANFTSGTVDNVAFANFITDIGKPTQETIPAGAWIFQCYLSASATSTCQVYATVEVYNGTTFTVLATSLNEVITNNTTKDLYTFTCAVPEYTPLTPSDRIVIRFYPANLSGNTITLYTQDSNLSSLQTTFTTGIASLDGLTSAAQYFQVGTSGTDFAITTSGTDTHLFNLPTASASNRGALSSTDWTTFNSKIGGSGTTNEISYFTASGTIASLSTATYPSLTELSYVKGVTSAIQTQIDNTYIARVQSVVSSATVTPTFANDEVIITAQAVNLTLNNPTGTATEGKSLIVRIKDNGTARSITFDTQYRAVNVNLPTSTTASRTLYLGMIYNATDTRWDVTGVALENANPDNTVQLLYYSNNC